VFQSGQDRYVRLMENPLRRALLKLLFAGSFVLSASLGEAGVSPSNQSEAAIRFEAVDDLARQTRAQGDLPRWSNPDHAEILARFWDAKATLGTPPYISADLPALLATADRAGALYKTYVLFAPQSGAVPDMSANTSKYQDEIARAAAYLLRVQAAEFEAIADFVKTLPAAEMTEPRRAGLQQMRLGINEMVTGAVLMLRSPGLYTANRNILLNSLADIAVTMSASTPPADRVAMIAQIEAVLPILAGPERENALAFKSAFERKECTGLCAVEGQ